MSDRSKAEKLADGKKKLRKYQSKQKKVKGEDEIENFENSVQQIENLKSGEVAPTADSKQIDLIENLPAASSLFSNSFQDFNNVKIPNVLNNAENTFYGGFQQNVPIAENSQAAFQTIEKTPVFNDNSVNNLYGNPNTFDNSGLTTYSAINNNHSQMSNLENLHQLSAQVGQLLSDSDNTGYEIQKAESGKIYAELEERNQELASLLNLEKLRSQELDIKLRDQLSLVDELRIEVHKFKFENSTKTKVELGPLQEQLQSHIQTIGILVGEKAELTASLSTYQNLAKEKSAQAEDYLGRLNASRHRVQELEKEITGLKASLDKLNGSQQDLCSKIEFYRDELKEVKLKHEEAVDEIAELKQKLVLKNNDYVHLQEELTKKDSALSLSQLRIEQLSAGDMLFADSKIEGITQHKFALEQQVNELLKQVEKIGQERDQASNQYQNYVTQLNKESTNLMQKVQELTVERDTLAKREAELIKHIGDLEKQIQQQLTKQKNNSVSNKNLEEMNDTKDLNDKISSLTNERDELLQKLSAQKDGHLKLQENLQQKIQIINQLEINIEKLQSEKLDPTKLSASIESDKVAASRAVSQNQDLKLQLEEMQKAFVQMTNDKAELTDKLQSEQHLCREMKIKFDQRENELSSVKEKLHYKDEEMMRLAHENTELSKEVLRHNQELDRLRHYEMNGQTINVLQMQIQKQKEQILKLQGIIRKFESESLKENSENAFEHQTNKESQDLTETVNEDNVLLASYDPELAAEASDELMSPTVIIPSNEAMEKLQERFSRTMNDIAELTEEKQRLEHLVTQLQGETETIGEYIALYQTQRKLLRQREIEKDTQLQRIIFDRENMKEKLLKLNSLVELLLKQKKINIPKHYLLDSESSYERTANGSNDSIVIEPDNKLINDNEEAALTIKTNEGFEESAVVSEQGSAETAEKILHLLTEIKTNNLNSSSLLSSSEGVHHCSCCSGKLLTV